ncbi:Heat shock 70 kDa protein 14-B [Stylophora pistillata]|uniref:Heat shock 70 kDa protein 14-B n=1 Tax=Stylophora pistillata TaxID=50429 RepID=A0A2B4SRP8_STYPI|nr:Heat shock 70 kDa protein 14-B [Stylophora pistillata]
MVPNGKRGVPLKAGRTDIIANDAGDRVTPALVAYSGKDKAIGLPAKQGLIRNSKNTMARACKIIGLKFSDDSVQQEVQDSDCKIVDKDGKPFYEVQLNEKTTLFSPKEVVKIIFEKLLKISQANGGNDIEEAVITTPLHFTHEQKTEIRSLVVYSLGGTTLDVTVLVVNGGMYRVAATESDTTLGGRKFDELLAHHLAAEFQRQWKLDVRSNTRAMAKLRASAENCKHILSSRDTATCAIESLCEGIDMNTKVSRARFESLCLSLFQQSLSSIDRVLSTADIARNNIDQVVLVGGSTRIPKIKQLVQEYFAEKEVCQTIDPDSVLAYGAAIQASLLQGREEQLNDTIEAECTSKAISVMLEEAEACLCPIIPKYSPIPLRKTHNFTTSVDNQESVCLSVYEEDHDMANNAGKTLVAKVVLEDIPPMAKGQAEIIGTFHIRSYHDNLALHGREFFPDKPFNLSLAQLVERWTVVREVEDSSPGWTNTQGLKITEENVLPFYNIKKWIEILVFSNKDE